MKKLTASRGPSVDIQKCVINCGGNKFDMVLIAAARAREIRKHYRESDSTEHLEEQVTALLDIQNGVVGREYLRKIR